MKVIGAVLMSVGVLWLIYAINMETSVTTGGNTIGGEIMGSGEYAFRTPEIKIPRQEVFNLAKAETRRTHITLAAITLISGVALFGFGTLNGSSLSLSAPKDRKCPSCAELVKGEAIVCRFCGTKLDPITLPDKGGAANALEAYAARPTPQVGEPTSFTVCETCRATNDARATVCFRCDAALQTEA